MKKNILDRNYPTHYIIDNHRTLCGTGWLQGTNYRQAVTCPKCLIALDAIVYDDRIEDMSKDEQDKFFECRGHVK
jgi:hypothetical protein